MKRKKRLSWKRVLLWIPVFFFGSTFSAMLLLKWFPVYVTPLMVVRSVSYMGDDNFRTRKKWMPLEKISPELVRAVMASEDSRFLTHKGFDWVELDKAIAANKKGKKLRGASTISQQTAKNVFLLPARSYIRKGLEAYFTWGIELLWGKKRIMEVYLNVAEMGRGIYGAEAAARNCFGTTAGGLNTTQASLISAVLPNPLMRDASRPSRYISGRAAMIRARMRMTPLPDWKELK